MTSLSQGLTAPAWPWFLSDSLFPILALLHAWAAYRITNQKEYKASEAKAAYKFQILMSIMICCRLKGKVEERQLVGCQGALAPAPRDLGSSGVSVINRLCDCRQLSNDPGTLLL